jgi:hypothetical protein
MNTFALTPPDPADLPNLPAIPEPEPELTLKEAEAAAADAGLSVLRVRKLKGSSILGRFIEQLGAQRIGRTTLVLAQDAIEAGIVQCDALLAQSNPDDVPVDLLIEVLKIRQAFTDQLIKTGSAQMKSDDRALLGASPSKTLNIPFPPGSKLAIQSAQETPKPLP